MRAAMARLDLAERRGADTVSLNHFGDRRANS